MSRPREQGAARPVPHPDNVTLFRALDLCAHMQAEEQAFVLALRASAPAPVPKAVAQWIQHGWVVKAGKWLRLTPAGHDAWYPPAAPAVPENWFIIIGAMPSLGILAGLVRQGVIENVHGFPRLTPLGKVVQDQLREAYGYIRAHPEIYESGDSLDRG